MIWRGVFRIQRITVRPGADAFRQIGIVFFVLSWDVVLSIQRIAVHPETDAYVGELSR